MTTATATETPVFRATEDSRIRQRQHLRRQLAEIAVSRERIGELKAMVAKLDADSDLAADEHQGTTTPLQEALAQLDSARVDAIMAGKQPADDAARRRELMQEIQFANQKLQDVVESNKKAKMPLAKQIGELMATTAKSQSLETEIIRLAPEAMQDQNWLSDRRLQGEWARQKFATAKVTENESLLKSAERDGNSENIAVYSARLRRWRLESADAARCVAEAHARSDELRARMLQD